MKKIIIINGSGGAGKDTFVEFCSEFCKVRNVSSVDKVKEAARILTGWNGEKDEKSRKLLVDLKQLGLQYNDAPFKYILNTVEEFEKTDEQVLFVHIREIDEIKKLKNAVDAKDLLVTNKNVEVITSNDSDKNVMSHEYDFYIKNDGSLDDLRNLAKEFITNLLNLNFML